MTLQIIKADSLVRSVDSPNLFYAINQQIQGLKFTLDLYQLTLCRMDYIRTFSDRGAMCDEYRSTCGIFVVRFYHPTGANPSNRDLKCSLCNGCVKETRGEDCKSG